MNKSVAVTFDLDFADYVGGGLISDELEQCWPIFIRICSEIPQLKTTWFIRLDEHIGEIFGKPDFIFSKHYDKIKWLRNNGHQVAWHFHSYRKYRGSWKQNRDNHEVAEELKRVIKFVKLHNLEMLRMGWAYHTDLTFSTIAALGVKTDCSAMPRPNYIWDNSLRDWTTTSVIPYFPSRTDYRIAGEENYGVLELPIYTLPIAAPYDTTSLVLRYLNPAYHKDIFQRAVLSSKEHNINTVSHPYEFLPSSHCHGMLAFDEKVFEQNLKYLLDLNFEFITMMESKNRVLKQLLRNKQYK